MVEREVSVQGLVPRYELEGWRERFGVVAGVTARGDGSAPFDLGLWTDAPIGVVMTRWRRFREAFPGFAGFVMAHQVHGCRVLTHQAAAGWVVHDGADGHLTRDPGVLLMVTVADCVPVYLVDPARRIVGLLHGGWRGTAAGILEAGLDRMTACGSLVENVLMHCGVGICGRCYEVGPEVLSACGVPGEGQGRGHLDLRAVLAERARRAGVEKVSTSQFCSAHDRAAFFSHRASGGRDGRMVAYVGLLP